MSGLRLALLGSGEFEPWAEEVDRMLLENAAFGDGSVLILPTASAPEGDDVFAGWAEKGLQHYRRQGIAAEVLPIKTRTDAEDPSTAAKLRGASLVFVSGGNPAYLAETLIGSLFWKSMLEALDEGLAYAGCSAGAACLGEFAPDSNVNELTAEVWRPGLALLPSAFVGPHWNVLDYYLPGLCDYFVASVPPGRKLLTIDEATAVIGDGNLWNVVGAGGAGFFSDGDWVHASTGQTLAASLTE